MRFLALQYVVLAVLALACGGKSGVDAPAVKAPPPGDWQGRCGTPADRAPALAARYPEGPPGAPKVRRGGSTMVVDQAGIFESATRTNLDREFAAFHRETCHQFAVVTVSSLNGLPIEDYSLSLVNTWTLGQVGLNNGLMILIAPNDRAARIEVGCGLEDVISDDYAAQVMREILIPAFRRSEYERGVREGMKALMDRARSKKVPPGYIHDCGGGAH